MLPPHPLLLHFIEVLEDYSRIRAERIVEIMQGKVIPRQVQEFVIPKIPDEYTNYENEPKYNTRQKKKKQKL